MTAAPLLAVDDLRVVFRRGGAAVRHQQAIRAVDGISFDVGASETLGLVGESGSGKSTTGRALLRLVPISGGSVTFDGVDLASLPARELRRLRSRVQMIFQDPYSSLDPSMVVGDVVAEPLEIHGERDRPARERRVRELLDLVRLSPSHRDRYPYELSGGQRQRVAIARAIALAPKLVVCDEAVSALDVSTQNQIINLLEDLQSELGMSYLFIAHDLAVVRHIAGRTAVMYLGQLVEIGPTDRVYEHAAHPYTQALLSAIPRPDPGPARRRDRIVLSGDIPDAASTPDGCAFHPRCPYAMDVCRAVRPAMTPVDGGGEVACHLQTSGPTLAGASLVEQGMHPGRAGPPGSPAG